MKTQPVASDEGTGGGPAAPTAPGRAGGSGPLAVPPARCPSSLPLVLVARVAPRPPGAAAPPRTPAGRPRTVTACATLSQTDTEAGDAQLRPSPRTCMTRLQQGTIHGTGLAGDQGAWRHAVPRVNGAAGPWLMERRTPGLPDPVVGPTATARRPRSQTATSLVGFTAERDRLRRMNGRGHTASRRSLAGVAGGDSRTWKPLSLRPRSASCRGRSSFSTVDGTVRPTPPQTWAGTVTPASAPAAPAAAAQFVSLTAPGGVTDNYSDHGRPPSPTNTRSMTVLSAVAWRGTLLASAQGAEPPQLKALRPQQRKARPPSNQKCTLRPAVHVRLVVRACGARVVAGAAVERRPVGSQSCGRERRRQWRRGRDRVVAWRRTSDPSRPPPSTSTPSVQSEGQGLGERVQRPAPSGQEPVNGK